jgi:hypothetical protein
MVISLIQAFSVVAQFAAVIGIFFLYRQIELSRKATQCQLINDLEKEFSSYYSVFAKLKPGGVWHDSATLSIDDIVQLETLASFCEKLKHFRDRRILDWRTLDLMFRNRFFLIMRNVNVITLVIEPCRNDWATALALEKEWRERLPESDPRRAD